MTARILIVSEVFGWAKPMEVLLGSAAFEVAIAMRHEDCLAACRLNWADIVLLDGTMPGGDAIALCRELKASPATSRIAVLVATRGSEPGRRLAALEAGADECLSDGMGALPLVSRIRSLAHWKSLSDEMHRLRAMKGLTEGEDPVPLAEPADLLVLDPDERSRSRLASLLSPEFRVICAEDAARSIPDVARGAYGIALVGLDWPDHDGLKLCRQLRLVAPSRDLRLLLITNRQDLRWQTLAENGIDDILDRPIDRNEALARVRLAQRKRDCAAALRDPSPSASRPGHRVHPAFRQVPPDRFAA